MWSCWNEWSECDAMCNGGEKTRDRTCDCPEGADEEECGCEGEPTESETCNEISCEDRKFKRS